MDAFRTLTGGSNFDRKRFKGDINHFQPTPSSSTPSTSNSTLIPAELDFFAASTTDKSSSTKKDKKRKRSATSTTTTATVKEEEEQDVASLIRKHRIKLTGLDLPSPVASINSIPCTSKSVLERLETNWNNLGLGKPTGIQIASWGIMLSNRDILACAPTGSGKTFSFIIPLLTLNPPTPTTSTTTKTSTSTSTLKKEKSLKPKAIVIEPTRELAVQVLRETKRLTTRTTEDDFEWKVGVLGEDGIGSIKKDKEKKKKKSGKKSKQIKKGKGKVVVESKEVNEGSNDEDDDQEEEDAEDAEKFVPVGDEESTTVEEDEAYLGPIDILITTPLRLVYAIKSNLVDLSELNHLILDEADKLFELNFLEQTDEILAACQNSRPESKSKEGGVDNFVVRKGMFSATMPSSVEEMAKTVMAGAGSGLVRAIVGHKEAATSTITQELQFVNTEDHKLLSLRSLITLGQFTPPVLIFVQSITRAKELTTELLLDGLSADCIHAERTGPERDLAVKEFAEGKVWALVCTDVMGRGIDFKGVKLVVNYDFPQSAMSYIHRIGRTGRAGKEGKAITFFTKADAGHLKTIVNVMRQSGCPVPDWMLALPNPSQDSKKSLKMKPIGRKDISRTNGAGTAGDAKSRERGHKRERVMGGKGGVFKRREGEDAEEKKGKKGKKNGGKEKKSEGGEDERQAKKPRKGKVDMNE